MKYWYDINSFEVISEEKLYDEYMTSDVKEEQTFPEYVSNCMVRNNGSLDKISNLIKLYENDYAIDKKSYIGLLKEYKEKPCKRLASLIEETKKLMIDELAHIKYLKTIA